MNTGPDVPTALCYDPDGCCPADACEMDQTTFVLRMRALLPPSEIFATLNCEPMQKRVVRGGAVDCYLVGCQQIVVGGCCVIEEPTCYDYGQMPQIAVFDSFAAGLFGVVQALCKALCEMDPCCAEETICYWAGRYGLVSDSDCARPVTTPVLKALVCLFSILQGNSLPLNMEQLRRLAAMFGANLVFEPAGQIGDCSYWPGWWTLAREPGEMLCSTVPAQCDGTPVPLQDVPPGPAASCGIDDRPSLNLILEPIDRVVPSYCGTTTLPHDPDLYEAFKLMLGIIVPAHLRSRLGLCVYEKDPNAVCDFIPIPLANQHGGLACAA